MEEGILQVPPRKGLANCAPGILTHSSSSGLCVSQAIAIPHNSSRSISMASISSEGSTESPIVEQEEIIALTHDVRTFKEALGRLKRVFGPERERSESLRATAHERLGEVLRILRSVLEKYSALQSSELLSAAGTLIQLVKGYNYENERADPKEFFEFIDQLALAFSSRVSEYLMGDLDNHLPTSLSSSVCSKTKSCENLASDLEIQDTRDEKKPEWLSPLQIDGVLMHLERGVEHALHRAKLWSKYAKDIMMYVEKRAHLELEYTKNMMKLSHTIRPLLKEEDYLPLQSIYCAALDHDLDNGNSNQVTCSLLLGNKFIEPLSVRRNEHERTRKQLKETWQKELKRMHEAISGLRKSRALYIQRQQEWERAREAAFRAGAPGILPGEAWTRVAEVPDQEKLDKRRRIEDDALQKAIEAETTYKAAVTEANDRHLQLQKVKAEILQQVRELIVQCDQTMKAVTVSYFQLQHTLSTPPPIQFQTLCESSKLYEPGHQYMEFVKHLPSGAAKDPLKSPFVFEPYNEGTAVLQKERKSTGSIDSEELSQGKDQQSIGHSTKTWSHAVQVTFGSDTDSISSSHSNKSQDTSPTASPMIPDRKMINVSSGDELENDQDNDPNFIGYGPAQRQCMSKAAVTHNFRKLKTPSRCRECDSYVYFQGADCSECGLACHKKCLETLAIQCGHKRLPRKMTTFGVDLGQHLTETSAQIPHLVYKCANEIDERGKYVKGIYRVSGVKSKVEKLCQAFENGADLVDLTDIHPNVIANVLKLYLRQLPEPLLTFRLYAEFVRIAKEYPSNSTYDTKMAIEELRNVTRKLPKHHYATLAVLMQHLKRVSEESETNNMPASNLGIVFGPTLLRTAEGSASLSSLVDTVHQTRAVELAIIHATDVFGSGDFLATKDNRPKADSHSFSRSTSVMSEKSRKMHKEPEVTPRTIVHQIEIQDEAIPGYVSDKDTSPLQEINFSPSAVADERLSGTSDDELPDFLLPDNSNTSKKPVSVQITQNAEKIFKGSLRDYQGLEGFSSSMSSTPDSSEKEHRKLRKSISDITHSTVTDPQERISLQTSQSGEMADSSSCRRTSSTKDPPLREGNSSVVNPPDKRNSIKGFASHIFLPGYDGRNEKKKSDATLTQVEVARLSGAQTESYERKASGGDDGDKSLEKSQQKAVTETLAKDVARDSNNSIICMKDATGNQYNILRKASPKLSQACLTGRRAESSVDSDYSFESHASSSVESRSPRDYDDEEGKMIFPTDYLDKRQSVSMDEVKLKDPNDIEDLDRNTAVKTIGRCSSDVIMKYDPDESREKVSSEDNVSSARKSILHHSSSLNKTQELQTASISGQDNFSYIPVYKQELDTHSAAAVSSQKSTSQLSEEKKEVTTMKSQYVGYDGNKLKIQVPPKAVKMSSSVVKNTSNHQEVSRAIKKQSLEYPSQQIQAIEHKSVLQSDSESKTVQGANLKKSMSGSSLSTSRERTGMSDRVTSSALRTSVIHRTVNMSQVARITNLTQAQNLTSCTPSVEGQPKDSYNAPLAAPKKDRAKEKLKKFP